MPSNICLALLSGLPASGKTTLANLFVELTQSITLDVVHSQSEDGKEQTKVIQISYDFLLPDDLQVDDENDPAQWKRYRKQVHTCVGQVLFYVTSQGISMTNAAKKLQEDENVRKEANGVHDKFCQLLRQQLLSENHSDPTALVIILDDNFFYRSMRYEYFQLARKYSVGFCEIYVSCPATTAVDRNRRRSVPVSDETYRNMMNKIEEPCPTKAPWETDYIIVDGGKNFSHFELSQMWGLVSDCLLNPVPPLEEEDLDAKEESRAASLSSVLHQADIVLRKCVSESIKAKKQDVEGSFDLQTFAATANKTKTAMLDRIREGAVSLPPLSTDQTEESSTPNEKFEDEIRRLYQKALTQ